MGCDVFWSCVEPDRDVQEKCTQFLLDVWKEARWEYHGFDEPEEGYFLNLDAAELVREKATWDVFGVSGRYLSRDFADEDLDELASRQLSFVFDNTPAPAGSGGAGRVVTVEPIRSFDLSKYGQIRPFFEMTPMDPEKDFYAVYRTAGYERFVGSIQELSSVWLLFALVRRLFLPTLEAHDDEDGIARLEPILDNLEAKFGLLTQLAEKGFPACLDPSHSGDDVAGILRGFRNHLWGMPILESNGDGSLKHVRDLAREIMEES
ncbi:MAG: hypothetical protein HN742_12095 [Lentisphaerae bacterium]|jgi:hypothetical protein|nr:hypothetical protein [Lentisphaerota bacterium]MBT5610602.1 hypothetical protein [Lentisphaerota bacterium]MBT7054489.1 hypothetical protein [Lentisphaerota bacterium]MBT7842609.1 hypothetical protein [Lentisphaerota bacterium]